MTLHRTVQWMTTMSALMRRALWSVEAPEQRVKLIKLDIVRHLLRRELKRSGRQIGHWWLFSGLLPLKWKLAALKCPLADQIARVRLCGNDVQMVKMLYIEHGVNSTEWALTNPGWHQTVIDQVIWCGRCSFWPRN